ncbi:MAG: zinc-ribbon domain-containing protein [Solidesulfovibrio sp. DCME]|uniref:zinc-ribbon domain-containing protein n=1 Tax=Solidesulfovibrio sp. DCME TaxID=3447380 RepID=UPI003D0D6697
MRCNKCGTESPDETRFCPVCGHKLQSDRPPGETDQGSEHGTAGRREGSRLLDFQGWTNPGRGIGPYVEACALAVILAGGAAACLYAGVLWPLYPLAAACALAIWLRRL